MWDKMEKTKIVSLELPETAFLMDIVYYWKNSNGIVKANGTYAGSELRDQNLIIAWSNKYIKTEDCDA